MVILGAVGSLQALWLFIFCLVTKEKVREVFQSWLKHVGNLFLCKYQKEKQIARDPSFRTESTNYSQSNESSFKNVNSLDPQAEPLKK